MEPEPKSGALSAATLQVNVSCARSPAPRLASESCAVTVAVPVAAVPGVPQNSRGSGPAQLPVPSASNTTPDGSPEAT